MLAILTGCEAESFDENYDPAELQRPNEDLTVLLTALSAKRRLQLRALERQRHHQNDPYGRRQIQL